MPPQTVSLPPPSSRPLVKDDAATVPRIVPVCRTVCWAAGVAVLVLLAPALNSVIRNDAFRWDVVLSYFATVPVLRGLWLTLWLTAVVVALGFVLAAAQSLGLGPWRRFRRIVLPQATRSIVPPAGNMLIGTLKGASIVSVIPVQDLLHSVQLVHHRTYEVIPLLLVATVWCAVVTTLLSIGQRYVERYYARGTAGAR
ncbi:ABC transporter permease subunit [Streptomyces anulatus]